MFFPRRDKCINAHSKPKLKQRHFFKILHGAAAELTPGQGEAFYEGPSSWHGQSGEGSHGPRSTVFVITP